MTFFSLTAIGQIESALYATCDNLYCKYNFKSGPDWLVVNGLEDGLTQMGRSPTAGTFSETLYASGNYGPKKCVWNFPIDVCFKSTNAYGWPILVLCVYGLDEFGRDIVRGYGAVRLPTTAGRHTLYVSTVVPISTSPFNGFLGWSSGRAPEFLDPNFVAQSKGREVTRVRSQGAIKIVLDIAIKDIDKFGYNIGA